MYIYLPVMCNKANVIRNCKAVYYFLLLVASELYKYKIKIQYLNKLT